MLELDMLLDKLSAAESLFTDGAPVLFALLNFDALFHTELVLHFGELFVFIWILKHLSSLLN
jgi:hypothetical protein